MADERETGLRPAVWQYGMLMAVSVALGLSWIRPKYPVEQTLQHIPTVLALVGLAWGVHRRWMSNGALACCVGFLVLHILGARYIYSFVPYDNWTDGLWGWRVSAKLGWTRNHYDRLVHLAFGGLAIIPLAEWATKGGKLSCNWALLFAVSGTLAISSGYEIAEWMLTLAMSPHHAEAYNGQQGDFWDAQKDMALAGLGSCVVAGLLWLFHRRK